MLQEQSVISPHPVTLSSPHRNLSVFQILTFTNQPEARHPYRSAPKMRYENMLRNNRRFLAHSIPGTQTKKTTHIMHTRYKDGTPKGEINCAFLMRMCVPIHILYAFIH